VFIVHEFITNETRNERHEANAADIAAFVYRLSGGASRELSPGQLAGPFPVPRNPLVGRPASLYLGKAQRRLRTPDA
jgi:hypothetical protein